MQIILILAHDDHRLIGRSGGLPWYNSEDFAHFKSTTLGSPVIMGRKTYESIGRPLPGRLNIIISRPDSGYISPPGTQWVTSSREALNEGGTPGSEKIFVIGGLQIYTLFLESGLDIELWISHIPGTHEGDVFFPEYLDRFEPYESKKYDSFDFIKYKAKN